MSSSKKEVSKIEKNSYGRYLFLGMFLLLIYLSYLIVRPFFTIIIVGLLVAYIAHPIFKFVHKYIKNRDIAALIVSIFLILILTIPAALLIIPAITQTQFFYIKTKQVILTGNLLGVPCTEQGITCSTINALQESLSDPEIRLYLQDAIQKATTSFIDTLSGVFFTLPKYLLAIFITFFITFYLFADGEKLINKIKSMLPVSRKIKESIFKRVSDVVFAVIYGSILIALLQGLLATIGYLVLGVNASILWGAATTLFALVPFIGTAFVWVPISIGLLLSGHNSGDPTLIWKGVILLIYGIFVISTADNLLKPKIVGSKAGIHPVFILLGALGGMLVFGPMGFIVGPVIFALLITFVNVYEKRLNGSKSKKK